MISESDRKQFEAAEEEVRNQGAARLPNEEDSSGTPREEPTAGSEEIQQAETGEIPQQEDPVEEMPAEILEGPLHSVRSGDVVKGTIVKVSPTEVIVDINTKSEGIIPMEDFAEEAQDLNLYVGKELDVLVVRAEGREGAPILSRKRAIEKVVRNTVSEAHQGGGYVKCRPVEKTKGGFRVELGGGVQGFMPFSQTGVRRGDEKGLEELVGKEIEAKVLELRPKRDPVLSRRACIEEKKQRMKAETLENVSEGAIVKGKVKTITGFGAFIDLGGVDALLHINDMSWQHVASPKEIVEPGQEIEVKVLSVEGEKISVGLKQRSADPWLAVPHKYKEGTKVRGTVTSLTKYGAFVEIEPGVEGLIHISEMSWTRRVKHPSEIFSEGDSVLCMVLQVNSEDRRISLGYKQTMEDPWKTAKEKYPTGTKISGEVTGLTDFGAFVRMEEGIEGLIHVSDMSWTTKIKHPSDVLTQGDIVEAVVMDINEKAKRVSLSLKHIVESPWQKAAKEFRQGDVVQATVKRLTDFGAFVEVAEGVEGLVHVSEISDRKIEHPSDALKEGQQVKAKVLKFSPEKERLNLSMKAYHADEARQEMQKYMEEQPKGLTSMGDIISSALARKGTGGNDRQDSDE